MKTVDYGNLVEATINAAVHDGLVVMGRRLLEDAKQNDHYTAEPMFFIEKRVKHMGYDPEYAENYAFLREGEEVTDPDEHARLDAFEQGTATEGQMPDGVEKVGFVWKWEHAYGPFFTPTMAASVLKAKAHEGDLRINVDSGVRNPEWVLIREALKQIALDADGPAVTQQAPAEPQS